MSKTSRPMFEALEERRFLSMTPLMMTSVSTVAHATAMVAGVDPSGGDQGNQQDGPDGENATGGPTDGAADGTNNDSTDNSSDTNTGGTDGSSGDQSDESDTPVTAAAAPKPVKAAKTHLHVAGKAHTVSHPVSHVHKRARHPHAARHHKHG